MAAGHGDDLIRVVGAVACRGDRVFMARRPPGGPHGGLWEFPGGKVEPGESDAEALVRELREELQVEARVAELVAVGRDSRIALHCYRVHWAGEAVPTEAQEVRWVPRNALAALPVPPADVAAVEALTGGPSEGVW